VFERFPALGIAYLGSGIGWVPYMMDRLGEEAEERGASEAPYVWDWTIRCLFLGLSALGRRLTANINTVRGRAAR
jgi:hypothetical protein